jgi:5-methyltetrahydropteroyltriglutamate--homocysteine methyltransferase
MNEFFADLSQCYRDEINALYKAGCRYIQLDDTNLAYLCDVKMRRKRGSAAMIPTNFRVPTLH